MQGFRLPFRNVAEMVLFNYEQGSEKDGGKLLSAFGG